MQPVIATLILSPSPVLRAGLQALLSAEDDIDVVASVASLAAMDEIPTAQVIVTVPGAWSSTPRPDGSVLLIGGETADILALSQANLPSWGVISPDAPAEVLGAAIRALAHGLVVTLPQVQLALLNRPAQSQSAAMQNAVEPLTPREIDVLRELAEGLTNKQIARKLGLSAHTVKFHVSAIYGKFGASNRAEATRTGARLGYLSI